ncbi:MAG: hypothetical protein RIQ51_1820, partial [Bacteroidota bacterium]
VKWCLVNILGKNACRINLHKEKITEQKHIYDFCNKSVKDTIWVKKCKNCGRKKISFSNPFYRAYNQWWEASSIKNG